MATHGAHHYLAAAFEGFAAGLHFQQCPHVQAGVVQGCDAGQRRVEVGVGLLNKAAGDVHIRTLVRSTDNPL